MSKKQEWEPYDAPDSPAERQGEPRVAPRTPYDDLPVVAPPPRVPAPRTGGRGRWVAAGAVGSVVLVVGGLAVLANLGDDDRPTSIDTMQTAHVYQGMVAALRQGPGTQVSSIYFTSSNAQVDVPLGGDRTEIYYFDELDGLQPSQKVEGDDPTFDVTELSADEYLAACSAMAEHPDDYNFCVVTPAGPRDQGRGGWIKVTLEREGGSGSTTVYNRSGVVMRSS
jgi:hypothetical protein